jgi:hypothetical protein
MSKLEKTTFPFRQSLQTFTVTNTDPRISGQMGFTVEDFER